MKEKTIVEDILEGVSETIEHLKGKTKLRTRKVEIKQYSDTDNTLQRAFSPNCPNCDEGRMLEIVYSHEFHRELYWCPKCGTINIEIDAKDTWLVPTLLKKEEVKLIEEKEK